MSGDHLADRVVATIGSWTFLVVQSVVLALWVVLNTTALVRHWDGPPFIAMNLLLSLQAAYAAPLILVAERRSTQALQLKLDEIIRAMPEARDEIIAAEKLPAEEIGRLHDERPHTDA